jgi:predicted RNase H-like HicB family nuclease
MFRELIRLLEDDGWQRILGAYCPDLPGLGVVGDSQDEVEPLIREAIRFHLDGLPPSWRVDPRADRSGNDARRSPRCLTELRVRAVWGGSHKAIHAFGGVVAKAPNTVG